MYDPQTGILQSETVGTKAIDSVSAQGSTTTPPPASDTKVGSLRLVVDKSGYSAIRLPERVVDASDPAVTDAGEPSEPSIRKDLTQAGQHPDIIEWLGLTRVRFDPVTNQKVSEAVDDTNIVTMKVVGTTSDPPVDDNARVGNVQLTSSESGTSAEIIPSRTTTLPTSGVRDVAAPNRGKRGRRGRRSRRNTPEDDILTEMEGQTGVVPAPVLVMR